MIKCYIAPDYSKASASAENGGIRRVVEAMVKHLPAFGIEVVHDPDLAQVIVNHGAMLVERPGVPSISVSHGMYWSRQPWGTDFQDVNAGVVENMRHAVAHTAPSEWVARAMRRGGLFYPEVVYHGVDADEFVPVKTPGNYVLWNKARADFVSDPRDLNNIAWKMPDTKFVTTIGNVSENVTVVGNIPHADMKKLVSEAGVYLATARETFGIGTLEAMAYGVPVAGWDWGGQSEIVIDGITGYLAKPGDYDALKICIEKCFRNRDVLSQYCIDAVRTSWRWEPRIEQYANIIKRVYEKYYSKVNPTVSVIVTAYHLDKYLKTCLDSIQAQDFDDFECLVVDDAQSLDTKAIVKQYKKDKRFKYVPTPENLGLPGARNFGLSKSKGEYIRHVDADDFLAGNCLSIEVEALDSNPGIHIVYGHLGMVDTEGQPMMENGQLKRYDWPPDHFDWFQQMAHLNQIPSCVMARRDVYEKSGGYRERMKRAEDADFWCRVTSLGYRAKKVTDAVTYYHRMRDNSKGALEWKNEGQEPDWTSWYPWRIGGRDYRSAIDIIRKYSGEHPDPLIVPFGAQGKAPKPLKFWYVHDYANPVVSIVVTCGPSHEKYLLDALDSIQAQTYPDWECIVVNDTGNEWVTDIMGAPWAKVINLPGNQGASAARNAGYELATGRFIIWMDADDYWTPLFLEKMVSAAESNDGIIYSDLIMLNEKNEYTVHRYGEFDCSRVPQGMGYPGSSVLIPRKVVESVIEYQGGWDKYIPGMEDWDYQMVMHDAGYCAYHVPEPLFIYRMYSSTKRDSDYAKIKEIVEYMDKKWKNYRNGVKPMGCGCGSKNLSLTQPESMLASSGEFLRNNPTAVITDTASGQMVMVEYVGPFTESFSIRSRVVRDISYRFGNNQYDRQCTVLLKDFEFLTSLTDRDGIPMYRAVGSGIPISENDTQNFIGKEINA